MKIIATLIPINLATLKVLNFVIFAIFDHFREILYRQKVSKPQNRKTKYPQN